MQMREAARIWCPLSLASLKASKVGPEVDSAQTFMVFVKRGAVAWSASEYKIWYVSVWLFLEARHESPLPPGTPLSRTDFLRKGFLRDCRGRAYQPLQRDEPAQTRF
jgi:hypothetical protein